MTVFPAHPTFGIFGGPAPTVADFDAYLLATPVVPALGETRLPLHVAARLELLIERAEAAGHRRDAVIGLVIARGLAALASETPAMAER